MQADSDIIEFFTGNILLIGSLGVVIFVYLIMLIRKRSKQNFLHRDQENKG